MPLCQQDASCPDSPDVGDAAIISTAVLLLYILWIIGWMNSTEETPQKRRSPCLRKNGVSKIGPASVAPARSYLPSLHQLRVPPSKCSDGETLQL